MEEVIAAIEAAAPEMTGQITHAAATMPVPEDVDGKPLEAAIGPVGWRSLADGVRQTVEQVRAAVSLGTIDIERAIG